MVGSRIAHYEILAKLGEGGMSEVYLARDSRLERNVALKVLPPELASSPDRLERFQREARSLASLDHPNIVHIYSVERVDGLHFLTMQLVDGPRLLDLIPHGALPLERLLEIAIPLTDALRAAHEKGITHRDLKPSNVMVDSEDRVKVLDFGLAKLCRPESDGLASQETTEAITREGVLLGTLPYMSPEQLQGHTVDHRSDFFSLGVVLYELAVGRHPFGGGNPAAVISAILRDIPPPVNTARPELPNQLGRIIGRCLRKRPRHRYQTALDLYNELVDLRYEVAGAGGRPAAARSGRARGLALAGAVALVLALTVLWVVRSGGRLVPPDESQTAVADAPSAIAIMPFAVRGSEEYEYLSAGLVDLLSTKLDGAGDLRAVDPHAVLGYVAGRTESVPTLAEARALAEHFDAGLHVVGEVVEAGGTLHVRATLYRAGETEPVSQASVEGPASELFGLIDRLAAELVTEQVSGPGADFTRLAAMTTGSLPALKHYLQGENELRAGQFTRALENFEASVGLDPDFALAWYRLSVAAEWAVRNDLAGPAAEEAVRLSERLSEHHQRLLSGRLLSRQGRPFEAERIYRAVVGTYPEDVEAWIQLAEVLSHYSHVTGRSLSESRRAWERTLELEPDQVAALWHLVRVEAVDRRDDEVRRVVDRLLELTPEAERVHELRVLRAFVAGDAAEQERALAGLSQVRDSLVALIGWSLALVTDDTRATGAIGRELTRPERSLEAQGLGHCVLAYTAMSRGSWAETEEHLRRARAVVPHLALEHRAYLATLDHLEVPRETLLELRDELGGWDARQVPAPGLDSFFFTATERLHPEIRLFLLGLVNARLGDPSALAYADRLTAGAAASAHPPLAANFAAAIRSAWWLEQGDEERSAAELGRMTHVGTSFQDAFSSPFFSLPGERLRRGRLAMRRGDVARAKRWLSSLAEVSFYDDALVPLSHLYRGELFGREGDLAAARRHFQSSLDLWTRPDAQLEPWVALARAGLARTSAAEP